jgi:hypothetical protein
MHAGCLREDGAGVAAQHSRNPNDRSPAASKATGASQLEGALTSCRSEDEWREACAKLTATVQSSADDINDIMDELRYTVAELAGSES